jgi:hypothetical protein
VLVLLCKHHNHFMCHHKHYVKIIFPLDYDPYKYLVEFCLQQLRTLVLFGDAASRGGTQGGKLSARVTCLHTHTRTHAHTIQWHLRTTYCSTHVSTGVPWEYLGSRNEDIFGYLGPWKCLCRSLVTAITILICRLLNTLSVRNKEYIWSLWVQAKFNITILN